MDAASILKKEEKGCDPESLAWGSPVLHQLPLESAGSLACWSQPDTALEGRLVICQDLTIEENMFV